MALLVFAALAWAVNVKLYLKDGTFHVVREYQVQSDRVHFYSVERSQWEDIPLDLVDLKRTETEAASRRAQLDADAKAMAEEDKAEREQKKEVSRIPQDAGVYWLEGNEVHVLKNAESTVHTNKGRSVLKRLFTAAAMNQPDRDYWLQRCDPLPSTGCFINLAHISR